MTAVCGFAQNFWQLFLARLGVGVGEAGGVAPSYSLVADYFPPQQRARALAVYSFGIPIGGALGILFGGSSPSRVDWRTAFMVVGARGRGGGAALQAGRARARARPLRRRQSALRGRRGSATSCACLLRKPAFWGLSCGAAASSMMGYGLFFWLPSFLVRSYGLTLLDASLYFGAILLVGGIAGIWFGGSLADRFGTARRRVYAYIPATAFVATVPFYVGAVTSSSLVRVLLPVPGADGARPRLARAGPVVDPARRAAQHAHHGLGDLPVHQQPDRHRARDGHARASCRTCSRLASGPSPCVTPSWRARRSISSRRRCSCCRRVDWRRTGSSELLVAKGAAAAATPQTDTM